MWNKAMEYGSQIIRCKRDNKALFLVRYEPRRILDDLITVRYSIRTVCNHTTLVHTGNKIISNGNSFLCSQDKIQYNLALFKRNWCAFRFFIPASHFLLSALKRHTRHIYYPPKALYPIPDGSDPGYPIPLKCNAIRPCPPPRPGRFRLQFAPCKLHSRTKHNFLHIKYNDLSKKS